MAASGGNIEVEEANYYKEKMPGWSAASLDAAHCTVARMGCQSEFCIVVSFHGPKMAQPTSLDHWPVQQPTRVLTTRQ